MTEDEMFRWHLQLNGYEFEQALGNGEGQGSLVCCSPWGCKQADTTEQLNRGNNLPVSDGTGCHDLSFRILSFRPAFSLSSFTFIKCLFSVPSLSAIRVMSPVYLRLLISEVEKYRYLNIDSKEIQKRFNALLYITTNWHF